MEKDSVSANKLALEAGYERMTGYRRIKGFIDDGLVTALPRDNRLKRNQIRFSPEEAEKVRKLLAQPAKAN